eukprot:TRINITY_DN10609_c0_g1_i1.p1 TRINITY_DN10609_c0_g1~~TRINITY_DN10609_c0_g1_i1.p1  ORF type:complete len:902 (-),score=170.50 TRINITY_DN10609_c0_g1_i1:6-2600(-)
MSNAKRCRPARVKVAALSQRPMQVFVQLPHGRPLLANVQPTDTILRLMWELFVKTGIHPSDQRLHYGGKPLREHLTFCDYNIHENSTVFLMLRLLGGFHGKVWLRFGDDVDSAIVQPAHGVTDSMDLKHFLTDREHGPFEDLHHVTAGDFDLWFCDAKMENAEVVPETTRHQPVHVRLSVRVSSPRTPKRDFGVSINSLSPKGKVLLSGLAARITTPEKLVMSMERMKVKDAQVAHEALAELQSRRHRLARLLNRDSTPLGLRYQLVDGTLEPVYAFTHEPRVSSGPAFTHPIVLNLDTSSALQRLPTDDTLRTRALATMVRHIQNVAATLFGSYRDADMMADTRLKTLRRLASNLIHGTNDSQRQFTVQAWQSALTVAWPAFCRLGESEIVSKEEWFSAVVLHPAIMPIFQPGSSGQWSFEKISPKSFGAPPSLDGEHWRYDFVLPLWLFGQRFPIIRGVARPTSHPVTDTDELLRDNDRLVKDFDNLFQLLEQHSVDTHGSESKFPLGIINIAGRLCVECILAYRGAAGKIVRFTVTRCNLITRPIESLQRLHAFKSLLEEAYSAHECIKRPGPNIIVGPSAFATKKVVLVGQRTAPKGAPLTKHDQFYEIGRQVESLTPEWTGDVGSERPDGVWVTRCRGQPGNGLYFLKRVPHDAPARLRQEARILEQCRHDHVVHTVSWRDDQGNVFIMQEVLQPLPSKYTLADVQRWLKMLVQALFAVHSAGFLHGDLRKAHTMLSADGELRLVDFGNALRLAPGCRWPVSQGTTGFVAPEVGNGEGNGVAPELWALGLWIYELVRPLLPDNSRTLNIGNWAEPDLQRLAPGIRSAVQLAQLLMHRLPRQRIALRDVFQHVFVRHQLY